MEGGNTMGDFVVEPERPVPDGFVHIQGGTFTMGSPDTEAERYSDNEGPQHQVTVSGFLMGKYEVTQKEWVEIMGSNPSKFTKEWYDNPSKFTDNLPVERVSWYDVIVYCNKRSIAEGLTPAYTISGSTDPADWGDIPTTMSDITWDNVTWNRSANGYRLPTEAEWEYACRAGTNTPFSTGDNITTDQANYDGNRPYNGNPSGIYRQTTTAVGNFASNGWGLYDMHGNVWEWCWDRKGDYGSEFQDNPVGASSGLTPIVRGGCYFSQAQFVRSAMRGMFTPNDRQDYLGFRLVRP
jgi:formylglycine-generating enzyme required for sulfatase activity